MSFDFATEKVCTHEVAFETSVFDVFIGDTLRFLRPPVSSRVHVFIDGVDVPQGGLYSQASVTFTRPEPYRLRSGKNDLIYLSIGPEPPRIIQLPSGSMLAKDLVHYLRRQIFDINFDAVNGRVQISARFPGPARGFSFHDPRWTDRTQSMPNTARILGAYAELGIVPGRVATGTRIFPGWRIISDPNSFVDEKIIVFDTPLQNRSPTAQLSYQTDAGNCRRCYGSRIEFDYTVLNNSYDVVDRADLLFQEFDKFLFTKAGSHWKWPWIGTNITDRVGGKAATAFNQSQAFISMDATQAFKGYQDIKSQQDKLIFQQVTDEEYPVSLDDLTIQFSEVDPTVAVVSASITTRSQGTVELKRIVGNPDPLFLAGNSTPFLQRG